MSDILDSTDVWVRNRGKIYFIIDEAQGAIKALGDTFRIVGFLKNARFKWRKKVWTLQVSPYPLDYMTPEQQKEELKRLRFAVKRLFYEVYRLGPRTRRRIVWLIYEGNERYRVLKDPLDYVYSGSELAVAK